MNLRLILITTVLVLNHSLLLIILKKNFTQLKHVYKYKPKIKTSQYLPHTQIKRQSNAEKIKVQTREPNK